MRGPRSSGLAYTHTHWMAVPFTTTPLVIQTCYTVGGETAATDYQASWPLVQMWPLLWPSRPEIPPNVIKLFFWVDLSQAFQGMSCPLGKKRADSPEFSHCWALLESCLVEIYLPAALWSVEKLGWCWRMVLGRGACSLASSASNAFLLNFFCI